MVPAGQDGEVQLRGPNVMRGYHGMPEATAKVLDADGWFRTGDMGQLDADGYLSITGRIKEMLIVGGKMSSPGRSNQSWKPIPMSKRAGSLAALMTNEVRFRWPLWSCGMTLPSAGRIAFLGRGALRAYQCPREVLVVESLPAIQPEKFNVGNFTPCCPRF